MIEEAFTLVLTTLFAAGGGILYLKKLKLLASLLSVKNNFATEIWNDEYWGPHSDIFRSTIESLIEKKYIEKVFLPLHPSERIYEPTHNLIFLRKEKIKEIYETYTDILRDCFISQALFFNALPVSLLLYFAVEEWKREENIKKDVPSSSICILEKRIREDMVSDWLKHLKNQGVRFDEEPEYNVATLLLRIEIPPELLEQRYSYLQVTDYYKHYFMNELPRYFSDWKILDDCILKEIKNAVHGNKQIQRILVGVSKELKDLYNDIISSESLERKLQILHYDYKKLLQQEENPNKYWDATIDYIRELFNVTKKDKILVELRINSNKVFCVIPFRMRKLAEKARREKKTMVKGNPAPFIWSILQPEHLIAGNQVTPVHSRIIDVYL